MQQESQPERSDALKQCYLATAAPQEPWYLTFCVSWGRGRRLSAALAAFEPNDHSHLIQNQQTSLDFFISGRPL